MNDTQTNDMIKSVNDFMETYKFMNGIYSISKPSTLVRFKNLIYLYFYAKTQRPCVSRFNRTLFTHLNDFDLINKFSSCFYFLKF